MKDEAVQARGPDQLRGAGDEPGAEGGEEDDDDEDPLTFIMRVQKRPRVVVEEPDRFESMAADMGAPF